jgi:hypothetical protein
MTPQTAEALATGLRLLVELATATGLGAAALKLLAAKGVDVQRIQNSNLVQAAENTAQSLMLDILVQGKSIKDPAVLADAVAALKTSLSSSHGETVAALGASPADIQRIAANALGKVGLPILAAP